MTNGGEHTQLHYKKTTLSSVSCLQIQQLRGVSALLVLLSLQGHSHQIWSDQVGSAPARTLYPSGAWGHAPPGS